MRDLLYLGIGGALLLKEKVESELQKLVERGKLSKEEAKKVLEEAKRKGEEEERKAKEELKRLLREVIEEIGVATKEDIEELKRLLAK